jgi:hypothetical protein
LFRTPSDLRELSSAEVVHLMNAYDQVQRRFGPLFRVLTNAELDEWIAIIQRGLESGDPFGLLCSLAPGEMSQLIVSFAERLLKLQTGNGSSGSLSEDGRETTSTSKADK